MYSSFALFPLVLPLVSAFNTYRSTLTDCLNEAAVPIFLSSSVGWADQIEPYNLRLAPAPTVVVIPRTLVDVQEAVKCASRTSTKVSVKGGGHSYGAYGLSGAMVMNMMEFQDVTLDSATNIASVGGGARLGNMASTLFNLGQRALPHGTCAGVGVGGHATLGGFGYDSRQWGLLVDTVVQLDVVLANGTSTSVSTSQHPELFWALRGAGAGFAVVTTFHFQTLPAPPVNIVFDIGFSFTSAATEAAAFQYATAWGQQNAPKELGFGFYLAGQAFDINGVYYGSRAAFDALVAPLLAGMKAFNNGVLATPSVQELGWLDSLTSLSGSNLITPASGDGTHDTFYVKSIDTQQSAPLSLAALTSVFTYLYNTPQPAGSDWYIISNLYGGPGSQITAPPPSTDAASTSSYAGRDSSYVWQIYGYAANSLPPFNDNVIPFIKGIVDALGAEGANLPAYAPYADTAFSREEAQVRYWGAGVPRLMAVKAAYDPMGILYNPQGF